MDDNKKRALSAALGQIEKQFGKGSVMRMGDRTIEATEVVGTGSLMLDIALGIGGLPKGRVVEIYGPESSGKTTLTLQAIAQCQKAGGTCAFIDAEHALDPIYAAKLGVNVDDLGDYRPGLDAARQAGALSPLVEIGFTKADVRAASAAIGLPIWDKPAAACLSSRIPYGTSVTRDRLSQIGGLEGDLKALGFRQVRVRFHDKVARIEVALGELERMFAPGVREAIVEAGKRHGFTYVTLDLAGYRTGSHNEVLVGRSLKLV